MSGRDGTSGHVIDMRRGYNLCKEDKQECMDGGMLGETGS